MPCKAVNFLLGLCVIKRAGYQQKYRQKMLWSSLCAIKVAMIKKSKGNSQEQPGTTKPCLIICLGERWRCCLQLTGKQWPACIPEPYTERKIFFFFSLSAGFLAFDMMHVFLSVPLHEFDAFSSSILQLIPLPPFPWENLNCWIDVVVLFSMGNLPPQQHSSPCQKYFSLDLAFRWVKALFQKMGLFSILGWKCKVFFKG